MNTDLKIKDSFILPILYKTSNKKTQQWRCWVDHYQDYSIIKVEFGQMDGKKQIKETYVNYGKNVNKKNQTDHIQQSKNESQSKWNKQCDKGYSLTGEKTFLPMLAKEFKEHSKKVIYPCYVQPKLDGLRSWITWDDSLNRVIARSRKGKEWKVIDHIIKEVQDFLIKNKNIILDGEIYCDPKVLSFQKICSAVKRDKANEESLKAQFWCYDLFVKDNPKMGFLDRRAMFPFKEYIANNIVVEVKSYIALNEKEIKEIHQNNLKNKYEGSMIRNIHSIYKVDGRSFDLLKLKDFQDAEYEIIDKTIDKNGETVFVCLDSKTNKAFSCKPEGTHEERVDYIHQDNIGKMLTVRFFELTTDGLPRFPIGTGIRDYE